MRLFFARIRDIILRLVKFFTKDIWVLDFSELSDARKRTVKNAQALVLTAKGFVNERVGREAVALSQFTLMAFVPMVAVVLFVTDGVGIERFLLDSLAESFPSSLPLVEAISKYADNMVAATQNGLFGWISFLSFVWTIIWLMINVGIAFNRIWEVRKPRKLWKRVAAYVAILFVSPFVLVLFFSGWVWYGRFIGMVADHLGPLSFIKSNLFWLAFYGVAVLALSVMYKFIPHATGRYGSALKAALIIGVPFTAIQYLYEEKIAVAKSRLSGDTKICCTRYGNVMCSRGSVIPLWIDQIRKGNPITITEPSMTRFIMSLEEAVDLVLFAFENGKNGDILVQKAPACTIQTQAEAVVELFKHQAPNTPEIRVIGIRHGEKMYETLLTKEEAAKAIDMGNFYAVPADNRDLNYDKFFKEGDVKRATIEEFNSNNTKRLNLEETKEKIASLTYIQNELNGIPNLV